MSTEEIAQVTAAIAQVTLRSSDNEEFVVDLKSAMLSTTLKYLIDDDCADSVVPLPNVAGNILSKVIEYCRKHSEAAVEENLKEWDARFVDVDQATLFDLILAANYLDIKGLLDLTCQCVANMIKGKSPEEIRATFNIKNDFSPDEEEEIRRENQWAFD